MLVIAGITVGREHHLAKRDLASDIVLVLVIAMLVIAILGEGLRRRYRCYRLWGGTDYVWIITRGSLLAPSPATSRAVRGVRYRHLVVPDNSFDHRRRIRELQFLDTPLTLADLGGDGVEPFLYLGRNLPKLFEVCLLIRVRLIARGAALQVSKDIAQAARALALRFASAFRQCRFVPGVDGRLLRPEHSLLDDLREALQRPNDRRKKAARVVGLVPGDQ